MSDFKNLIYLSINPYPTGLDFLDDSCVTDEEFYFPNMCHVCRCFGEKSPNLKRCSACGLISYCSKEHQLKNWPSHKQFCKAITQLKKKLNVDNIFYKLKQQVRKYRIQNSLSLDVNDTRREGLIEYQVQNFIFPIIRLIGRKLTKAEYEIIRCPRVCAICYETKQNILVNCKKCPQASFCMKHLNSTSSHDAECVKILHCYYKSSNKKINDAFSTLSIPIENMSISHYPKVKELPTTIVEFLETRLKDDLMEMDKFTRTTFTEELKSIYNAFLSERYSRPLSLIFAIKQLSLTANKSKLTVHVVGSTTLEQHMSDWEMIMHYLPNLQQLDLILIGIEVPFDFQMMMSVCSQCRRDDKKFMITTRNAVYDKYCRDGDYRKPDIIACFNPGFHVFDQWKKSIKSFKKGKCPLLVTTLQGMEAIIERGLISSEFPLANCIFNDSNPYSSLAYQREVIFYPLASRDQWMLIYDSLN